MKILALVPVLFLLGACAVTGTGSGIDTELQMFVSGDISNAQAIAMAGGNAQYAACMSALAPVAMASPTPANDGLLVVGARSANLQAAVNGACGPILAPLLLKKLGKLAGPFGVGLPF
jgi:hypothetical protein